MPNTIGFEFPENPWRVAVMGDWHGDAFWAEFMIETAANLGAEAVVHVGDFGFQRHNSHSEKYMSRVNRALKKADLNILVVDGNHEDFEYLYGIPLNDQGFRPITRTVAHLPRGFRWTWWDKTWAALGGAHSVNSHLLTPGYDWFPEEHITWDETERVIEGGPADVMVTHDVPDKTHIVGLGSGSMFPSSQLYTAQQHRTVLGMVVDELRPELLLHGHMHIRHDSVRELPDGGETQVIGVDCNGSDWRKNMVLVDAMTLELLPMHESIARPIVEEDL